MEGASHFEFQEHEQDVPASLLDNPHDVDTTERQSPAGCWIPDLMVLQKKPPQAEKGGV
jgi:hypothetical protein